MKILLKSKSRNARDESSLFILVHHAGANQKTVFFLIKRNEFEELLKELPTNGSNQVRYEIAIFFLKFLHLEGL